MRGSRFFLCFLSDRQAGFTVREPGADRRMMTRFYRKKTEKIDERKNSRENRDFQFFRILLSMFHKRKPGVLYNVLPFTKSS